MYVRLAFAVAAHMESEILLQTRYSLLRMQFQKRCFSKIREAGREGKTIVLVSHNMAAVRNICSRGVLLRQGRVTRCGEINEIVDAYVSESLDGNSETTIEETESFWWTRFS